jgi:predicted Zn-dependent protease
MFDTLRPILDRLDVDYADLRHEIRRDVMVSFAGRDLTQVGSNAADGYVLRVLDGGGLASVAFTRREDAEKSIATAIENARLLGSRMEKPVTLAPTETIVDDVRPDLVEDPRDVSLDEKVDLLRGYVEIPLAHEEIATTNLAYRETIRERHFVSTEGTAIREDLVTTACSGTVVARRGNLTQDVRMASGGSTGFQHVRGQEENLEARTKMALDLLDATPAKGGTYDCILNPYLAGVFAHEAFGHFSEADIVETHPSLGKKMALGAKLGSDVVTIIDDATRPGQLGFYRYDDEGVPVRRRPLMENGVLTGRLHSRRTAASFGEPLSGHNIAEDYRFAPIIRMGCIAIDPGENTFDDLLARLGDGLYIIDPKGGQTSGENFSFGAHCAYEVKNGKVGRMRRDLNILGNLYRTLQDIEAVGDEVDLSRCGGCGKGQLNIRSCLGGPDILIRNLVVGGV